MATQPVRSDVEGIGQYGNQTVIATSGYTFAELAEIYNETRVDYIVPMPMNARRMEEYVRHYDINLDASYVALNEANEPTGVGMLGLRDDRAWITRLGVIPHRRGRKTGQMLTQLMLDNAQSGGCKLAQLEVIKGNEPAYRLFRKLGFEEIRELLIIRRPPAPPADLPQFNTASITPLSDDDIAAHLTAYNAGVSWVEEGRSIMQAGSLKGFALTLESGESGWVIFRHLAFQIEHIVFSSTQAQDSTLVHALLYHLHRQYPRQDTKVENIPTDSPVWPVYQQLGYVESFRRLEMFLYF